MKVYIAVPSSRDWKMAFGTSLINLIYRTAKEGIFTYLHAVNGASCLPRARQDILNKAIQEGFTHILFLDDDMKFPDDALLRLLNHNLPCVAANYRRKIDKLEGTATDLKGRSIHSSYKTGIQEVMFAGMGVMLIELEKIKHIKAPHFEMPWVEDIQNYLMEDCFFCNKLRENQVPVYIDHDLVVGHIGDFEYKFTSIQEAYREVA